MKTSLAFALWFASSVVFAQDEQPIPACVQWMNHPLPDEARAQENKGCDSDASMVAKHYTQARACAWSERAEVQPEYGELGASATLLALYANGWGVQRDYGLARRLACEAGFAPAEIQARLERIAAMQAGTQKEPLDFCADITSGYMMGHCAQRQALQEGAARAKHWKVLLENWPVAHRTAFTALRKAADAFFEERMQGEVDASGTARGAFILGEQQALENGLLQSVQAFERGELPQASTGDLAQADRRLNQTYAAARKAATFDDPAAMFGPLGSISPDGIREAERAWIRYRDAWVKFGAVRYPSVTPNAWNHWLTVQRERQLRALYEG